MIGPPRADLRQATVLECQQPHHRGRVELVAAGALVVADPAPDTQAPDPERPRHALDGARMDDPPARLVIGSVRPHRSDR